MTPLAPSTISPPFGSIRSCYVNFAEHLLNAYNPNVASAVDLYRWNDADWFRFIDMIAAFGFNVFEFWLAPRLFCKRGLSEPYGEAFARQIQRIVDHASTKGVGVKMMACLTTVDDDWHTHCPNIRDEWQEVLHLWDAWTKRVKNLAMVGIFPGDPGGCSRNGCDHRTFVDSALRVAEIIHRNQPGAAVEIGTWGTPFWGWGTLKTPPNWKGEFVAEIQASGWDADRRRADDAFAYLLKRLPEFPTDTIVSINLGLNSDGDPSGHDGQDDARPWAREIARVRPIMTWDFSLTEGENAIFPHYRFERLFARRRAERDAAPYSGGICFTMTPMLNQLSLYQSAQSLLNPDADPRQLTREFYTKLFGPAAAELSELLPLFEVVPDWGNFTGVQYVRDDFHRAMVRGVELVESLKPSNDPALPIHPSPEAYRNELQFFFQLFADLSDKSPDFDQLRQRYWQRVYAIYDHLPRHIDDRPQRATDALVDFFRNNATRANTPIPGKWSA